MTVRTRAYSDAEDAYLRAHANDPLAELAAVLSRPQESIRRRLSTIRAPREPARYWTPARVAELTRLVELKYSDLQIGRAMLCSQRMVKRRRQMLGLVLPPSRAQVLTPEQKREAVEMKRSTPELGCGRIAKALGVSDRAVRRGLLGWERAAEAEPPPISDKHERFVETLIALGGMPHFHWPDKVHKPGVVWLLGPDNRPWIDPDRRRAAA